MADQLLVTIVDVTLAPLGSTVVTHGLTAGGVPVKPTQVICDTDSTIAVTNATTTQVFFVNTGAVPATAKFRIEYDHSIHAVDAAPLYWKGATAGAGAAFAAVYGAFSDSVDQIVPAAPSALAVQYDTVDAAGGVTVANNGLGVPTRLTVPVTGIYKFDLSPQLFHSGGGTEIISFWARINGVNVPNSTSSLEMGNNNNRTLPFISIIAAMNAGQYLEWFFQASSGTNTTLEHYPAAGLLPANPSVIANVQRIA